MPVKCVLTLSVSSLLLVPASVTYCRNNRCNCVDLPEQRSAIELILSFLWQYCLRLVRSGCWFYTRYKNIYIYIFKFFDSCVWSTRRVNFLKCSVGVGLHVSCPRCSFILQSTNHLAVMTCSGVEPGCCLVDCRVLATRSTVQCRV